RFWSHPFSNTTSLSHIQNYIDVTGTGGASNGFTTTATNDASAYYYNPTVGNSAASYDPGWRAFTSAYGTADSNRLHQYQGFRIFIRGRKGEGLGYGSYTPSSTVIGQWGQLNQGRQVVRLQKGTSSGQDYNLIGNPYASPVDIGTVLYNARATGNIAGTFYVWNPYMGAGGQYQAVTISSTSPTPYYLQANCAFQVRALHNNDTLVFNESDKSATVTTSLLRDNSEYVTLNVYDEHYHQFDELRIRFNNGSSATDDSMEDAVKPMGPDFNFYSLSADNHKLAIDVRSFSDKPVALGINSNLAQDFIIRAENVVIPEGKTLYLHDKLLGTYNELVQGAEYRFTIDKETSTQGEGRFELAAKPEVQQTSGTEVVMTPNPATDDVKLTFRTSEKGRGSVTVTDVNGVAVYSLNIADVQQGNVTVPLRNLAAGIYLVEFAAGDKKVVQRLVKE
ncbi:MAG: T9SS C-terminal target domain-containing protein, partial [Chitinophagia bacterium]|nr:T9SS C-terminal target domain-containing protein [Chitinophagia bacterium]